MPVAISTDYFIIQIPPLRILFFNKSILPISVPAFDLLLSCYRQLCFRVNLITDKLFNIVSTSKAFGINMVLVFVNPVYNTLLFSFVSM